MLVLQTRASPQSCEMRALRGSVEDGLSGVSARRVEHRLQWRSAALPFSRMRFRALRNVKYAGIDADRFTVGERDGELPVAMQNEATIDVGGGKVRIELDGLIEIGNGPLMATSLVPDQAAVAVEVGVSEAEPD